MNLFLEKQLPRLIDKPIERYSKNCYYCDKSKIHVNRAFICDIKSNCSTFQTSEKQKFCSESRDVKFKCNDSDIFIEHFQVCNFVDDCKNGLDEKSCSEIY